MGGFIEKTGNAKSVHARVHTHTCTYVYYRVVRGYYYIDPFVFRNPGSAAVKKTEKQFSSVSYLRDGEFRFFFFFYIYTYYVYRRGTYAFSNMPEVNIIYV